MNCSNVHVYWKETHLRVTANLQAMYIFIICNAVFISPFIPTVSMLSTKQESDLVGQDLWSVASGVVVQKLGWLYRKYLSNFIVMILVTYLLWLFMVCFMVCCESE